MVTIPLGVQAYKRKFAGEPEVKLVNRFLETNPTNPREHSALLTRAGSNPLTKFDGGGALAANRNQFAKPGLFDGDLFGVAGPNLYRYGTDGTLTHITGLINGSGIVTYAWMKGIGYEFLFIADGLLLQYYNGGTQATGVLTSSDTTVHTQVIQIGGVYYGWNAAVDTNGPNGTAAHPWLANPGTDPIQAMANLINFDGVRGVDFSTALGGPNPAYSAATNDTDGSSPPATEMTITATSEYADGNSISTTVVSGADLSWAHATLTGGGVHALHGVEMPDGDPALALASLSGYVLVSVGASQKFYWLNPGETVIDALNFAEKESNPDNIVDMITIGDQTMICGAGSVENWYATGDSEVPFAPVEGRVYRRGIIEGTAVAVKDSLFIVGDDGVVYSIGYTYGATGQYGVNRVSTHAIEERIRTQLRREQELVP